MDAIAVPQLWEKLLRLKMWLRLFVLNDNAVIIAQLGFDDHPLKNQMYVR
jgi:hypothetical protein